MSKVDVKVVLLGQHNVGKTCLVERYLHNTWKEKTTTTVGAAFGAKRLVVDSQAVTLGIWDTAGSERYESMSKIYYRQAKAAIVCFDLTQRETFQKVKFWVEELLQNEEQCATYIVGTKFDLVQADPSCRAVPSEEVEAYAESVGCAGVFETSAKDNSNIENLFQTIARGWLEKNKKPTAFAGSSAQAGVSVGGSSQAGASDSGSCCR